MARIVPLRSAYLADVPASTTRYGSYGSSAPTAAPVLAFLVEAGADDWLAFDTGCAPAMPDVATMPPHARVVEHTPLAELVVAAGVDPRHVRRVVLSHLHWDHCSGLADLPAAEILLQRAECRVAIAPDPWQAVAYTAWELGGEPGWLTHLDRVTLLDGDTDLGGGLRVVHLPGHTPGSQGLVVPGDDGRVFCLAGDLLPSYDNWLGAPRAGRRGGTGPLPPGLHTDLGQWRASVDRLRDNDWTPLPAHDDRVVDVLAGTWAVRP